MDWENRQRMEESMAYNQYSPAIPEEYFAPSILAYIFKYK